MPVAAQQPAADHVALPNAPGSLKFAVLGDLGTGERAQYELAEQMARLRERFTFEFVILVGGNLYGSERPQDFLKKFEMPYKPLLDAGVTFHASLGKDDSREQRYYKLFNMGGKPYYTFSPRPDVRFFALDSTYARPEQIQWLEQQLQASSAAWKIAFFHQPLYSSGAAAGLECASATDAGAAVRQIQRQRRADWPGPLLRARNTPAGHRPLRGGVEWTIAAGPPATVPAA